MGRGGAQTAEHGAVPAQSHHDIAVMGERGLGSPGHTVGQPRVALQPHEGHLMGGRPGSDLLQRVVQVALGAQDEPQAADGG